MASKVSRVSVLGTVKVFTTTADSAGLSRTMIATCALRRRRCSSTDSAAWMLCGLENDCRHDSAI